MFDLHGRRTSHLSSLYQFQGIGEDDEDVTLRLENDNRIFFRPRPLRNLVAIDGIQNAFPVTDMLVENFFNEETPQIVTACGTGPRSSIRVLRHGLAVSERAVSQLPGVPSAVWSIKTHVSEEYDRYIIVSFKDATMVLSIGETVEEVHDSGFLAVLCLSLPLTFSLCVYIVSDVAVCPHDCLWTLRRRLVGASSSSRFASYSC